MSTPSTTEQRPGVVRVDFYKASGKWYTTDELDMTDFFDHGIDSKEAVIAALEAAGLVRPQFITVVADPYCRYEVPVLIPASR